MSPRKRKRSDVESMSDESWIETEDEVPEFIAEGKLAPSLSSDVARRPTPLATGTSLGPPPLAQE